MPILRCYNCFYQFLHDVIIVLFCRSKQNNFVITWKSLVFLEAAQSGLVLPKNINFIPFAYDSRHIEDRVSNVCGLYMLVRYH